MRLNLTSKANHRSHICVARPKAEELPKIIRTFCTFAVISISGPVMGNDDAASPVAAAVMLSPTTVIKNNSPAAKTDYVDLKSASMAFNVLANDSDADGDKLIILEANANFGAVAFTPQGLIAYAQEAGQARADKITYVIGDGRGGLGTGVVEISVR